VICFLQPIVVLSVAFILRVDLMWQRAKGGKVMIVIADKKDCVGCGACANICPKQCITMKEDSEGFAYPNIDKNTCINCCLCERVCPIINPPKYRKVQNVYACYNKDEQVRMDSSSGGFFSLLANYVLQKKGYVAGAAFDANLLVHHILINKAEGLPLLRGSKYLQSRMGDIYNSVQGALETGKPVLFSGTPCQCAGLKNFLGHEYENLFSVDVVCHGVPSPKVYRKKLNDVAEQIGENVVSVKFRDKSTGWKRCQLIFAGEKIIVKEIKQESPYMQAFLRNMSVRPSCSVCHYNNEHSSADLTIADYWGVETKFQELNDDKGVTVVLVNTTKGGSLFEKVRENAKVWESNFSHASQHNFAMKNVGTLHPAREVFFARLGAEKFDDLVHELLANSPK